MDKTRKSDLKVEKINADLFEDVVEGLKSQGYHEAGGGPTLRMLRKDDICEVKVFFVAGRRDSITVRYSYHKDE